MKLYLVRHGETDWNIEGKIQGSYDSELNENGIIQANELAKTILESNLNINKIYSSRQKRAHKTAEIISKAIHIDCIPTDGLEEINLGDWEGHSWSEVKTDYPNEYEEWYINRRYTKVPGGESYQDMLDRVISAIHTIINTNSDDVIIVTHSAVIMCLQCYITNTPFNKMAKFKVGNTTITELDSEMLMNVF